MTQHNPQQMVLMLTDAYIFDAVKHDERKALDDHLMVLKRGSTRRMADSYEHARAATCAALRAENRANRGRV